MENNLETEAISHCFKYLSWDINVPIQGYKWELEGAVEENSKKNAKKYFYLFVVCCKIVYCRKNLSEELPW